MKADKSNNFDESLKDNSSKNLPEQLFVIQKHSTSHPHYDFRLKMEDSETGELTLVSWAVPKNLPMVAEEKRLAIRVENRNLEHIGFEGAVPEGSYGAGKVEIWDKGVWGLMKGNLVDGRISFNLLGEKLKGRYQMMLVKDFDKKDINKKGMQKSKNWLIWKREAGDFF